MQNKTKDSVSHRKRKTILIFFQSFYYSSIAFVVLLLITNFVLPTAVMNVFGYNFYRMSSSSMSPTIDTNDFIIVKKASINDIQPNDIIMFSTNAQLHSVPITERVIVVHYFGYIDENHNIYTYKEENKALDDLNPDKYDVWGTETTPYFVQESDLLGKYISTINLQNVFRTFLTPYPYGLIAILMSGLGLAAVRHRKELHE